MDSFRKSGRSTDILTEDDRAQFSSWIGQRSRFELLYKISRDGCSSKTFHQLCDGKGPTVTILYNTDNTAYGGYLSQSWVSSGTHIKDPESFLFTLSYNGVQNRRKFPVTNPKKAAFGHVYFGPSFGDVNETNWSERESPRYQSKLRMESSSDLTTFRDTVTALRDKGSDTYFFNLNGRSDFGSAYQKPTVNMNAINNGHMCVFDLEVYLVKADVQMSSLKGPDLTVILSKAWREPPLWNEQNLQSLKDFVSSYKPLPDMKISEVNILLVGQINAGKSSFFNSLNSIFRGEISSRACAGTSPHSLTTNLRKYRIRNRETKSYLNFRLCDTRGLEEEMSMHLQDMALLLDGHLSDQYKFNPMAHATQRDPGFVLNATFQDKIHCVAFVVDASSIDVLQANVSQKLLHFRSLIVERGIPNVVYLTKLDKVCPLVDEDVRRVYHSQACKQALETAADVIGIPRGHVFPVKNYEKESQLQTNISIMALTAMRQTLVFADDYLEDKYELSQSQQ
nr:interferon-induced protein 44 [Crassostrea gigas]